MYLCILFSVIESLHQRGILFLSYEDFYKKLFARLFFVILGRSCCRLDSLRLLTPILQVPQGDGG